MLDPAARDPAVGAFVEDLAPGSPPLFTALDDRDEMFRYHLALARGHEASAAMLYYLKGWQIFEAIRGVAEARFGGLAGVGSLLDFASGFGRVTRFLARGLDPARVRVAEIQPEAVAFQERAFGVEGMVSPAEASRFDPGRRFDFVMAASFFSHVPDRSFRAWLAALLGSVAPGGVLAFTTNALELLGPDAAAPEGIRYEERSETDRLDARAYGTTHVSEAWVSAAVREAGGAGRAVLRLPRGLAALQDLYVVAEEPLPAATIAGAACFPWGDTDRYEIRGDRLTAAGWVETSEAGPPVERVALFSGNARVASGALERSGPRRARWSVETDARALGPDDALSVRAAAAGGRMNFVAQATLRTHPPARTAA